ncbi:uncharacterized protein LOC119580009 [Penaeus monodon]|uniref:uncharacterized protein LOC119580009 n=1 Tax=Penaeus monodon TaxID=6687 RepID=UPI0018A75914|nr:uncharacterized protein LOC119580009 [Penaeus monodon]XP_037783783.1 uncharacterized protein LOC119580009 [Penaeus monodon]XP_037783784.1 uncharacterized protein LOC119580009 [Penaeus monodon]
MKLLLQLTAPFKNSTRLAYQPSHWVPLRQPQTTVQARAMSSNSVKWLNPADREATSFHVAYEHGTRKGVYGMTINTTKALKEEEVRLSLRHLRRKHPPLRIGLQRRDGTVWFCEPDDSSLDFKVVHEGASIVEEIEKVSKEGLQNANRTSWVLRLIPRGEDVPCAVPGARSRFPHQYDVIFTGHHAIADGQGAMMFVVSLLEFINDIMNGNTIEEEEEEGEAFQKDEIWELEASVKQKLEKDPQRHEFVKQSLPSPSTTPLLLQAFPRPTGVIPSTRHVARAVDSHVTRNLQKKCKIHGVTLNSVIVASLNVAMMRLLKEAGLSQQSYTIRSCHAVNLGRYLKRTPPSAVGGYGLLLSYAADVDTNAQANFWQYCKKINQELKESLRSGLPLEQKMLKQMMHPNASPEKEFQDGIPVVHDFGVTNVGSFPTVEPGPDDNILITDVASYNILHQFVHMNLFQVLTFRGRCIFTMSYATDYIADETATSFADELMLVLQEVSDISNL